jgi:Rrf2 family protein
MFQLSKKVEYGLIAFRHMASRPPGEIHTVREIANRYQLPIELLAKVMQKLARERFIVSTQGVHGGYRLLGDPQGITVSSVIRAIEGRPAVKIVQCEAAGPKDCVIHSRCTIKDPLMKLQGNINQMLEELTVMQLV